MKRGQGGPARTPVVVVVVAVVELLRIQDDTRRLRRPGFRQS